MISIYHNPRCSKSRQTLALLESQGITPKQILYLVNPISPEELAEVIHKLGVSVRDIMRSNEQSYKDNHLDDKSLTDEQLIASICQHPKVLQRPIVINGDKAAIGRPPEAVLSIL